jgi:hypothetical protein
LVFGWVFAGHQINSQCDRAGLFNTEIVRAVPKDALEKAEYRAFRRTVNPPMYPVYHSKIVLETWNSRIHTGVVAVRTGFVAYRVS